MLSPSSGFISIHRNKKDCGRRIDTIHSAEPVTNRNVFEQDDPRPPRHRQRRFAFYFFVALFGIVSVGFSRVLKTENYPIFVLKGNISNTFTGFQETVDPMLDIEEVVLTPNDSSMCMHHYDLKAPRLIRNDIESVLHYPYENKILVHFQKAKNRTCKRPSILGRLSGPYASLISWNYEHLMNNTSAVNAEDPHSSEEAQRKRDSIVGHYILPKSGKYFIEIIGLLCNDLQFSMDFNDFRGICLEDPSCNRLTAPGSYINVMPTTHVKQNKSINGFWKYTGMGSAPPLYTRHQGQPQICERDSITKRSCKEAASLDRFSHYRFEWDYQIDEWIVHFRQRIGNNHRCTICLVGMSHSRTMAKQMRKFLSRHNMSELIGVEHICLERPGLMTELLSNTIKKHCNVTLIASGQWAAAGARYESVDGGESVPNVREKINTTHVTLLAGGTNHVIQKWGNATIFPKYRQEMKHLIQIMKRKNISFALRQIHHNALCFTKTRCNTRIQDHRWPPIIDRYNQIIKELASWHRIPFLDSSDIVNPLWDSAPDCSHYKNQVGEAESLWFVKEILALMKA